jgi:hypothetical protein
MKSGGLGSLPRGLEWINQNTQKAETQSSVNKIENTTVTQQQNVQPVTQVQPVTEKPQLAASVKPRAASKHTSESVSAGLPEGFTRATFIIKQDHIDRLKALSYVNKTPIKDLVDLAMTRFLKDKDVATILMEAVKENGSTEQK